MALSTRLVSVNTTDPNPASATVAARVSFEISTSDAEAVAAGLGVKTIEMACEMQRAAVPSLQAALASALVVVDDGGWPTAVIPLPLPRKS